MSTQQLVLTSLSLLRRCRCFRNMGLLTGCLVLIAGCAAAPVQPGSGANATTDATNAATTDQAKDEKQQPLKALGTPEAYFKEANAQTVAGNSEMALRYISEGVSRAPQNQAVRNLAGVAYARLGKGAEARQEFDAAVKLAPKTAEADTAREWLARFQKPLPMAIYPLKLDSTITVKNDKENFFQGKTRAQAFKDDFDNGIEQGYYTTIKNVVEKSGFYSVAELDLKNIEGEVNPVAACQDASQKGVPIAIICKKSMASYTENASIGGRIAALPLAIVAAALFGEQGGNVAGDVLINWTVKIDTTMDLYETKTARLITSVTKSSQKELTMTNIKEKTKEMVDELFEKMALEINQSLM
jgi:tetratricopeptide (TPR) repeat protein